MNIKIYKFAKKHNSTKIPVSEFKEVECTLDDFCTIEQPRLILQTPSDFVNKANYVYIPYFNKYYWITERIIDGNNFIAVSLFEDVLATYKEEIENISMIFSRTPFENPDVCEDLYPIKNFSTFEELNRIDFFGGNYYYVLADIVASGGNVNPTSTTYLFTTDELKEVMEKLYTPDIYGEGVQVTGDILTQTICNPIQYLTNVRFCSFRPATDSLSSNKIKVGWTEFDVSFTPKVLNSVSDMWWYSVTLPNYKNPKTDHIMLYIPCCGIIEIPNIYAGKSLKVKHMLDLSTGAYSGYVYITDNNIDYLIDIVESNLTPSFALSGVVHNFNPSLVKGAVGLGMGIGNLLGKSNLSLSEIGDTLFSSTANALVDNSVKTISSAGGNIAEILGSRDIILFNIHTDMLIEHSNKFGYANCYEGTMSTDGFYKASSCNPAIACSNWELENIKSLLLSGVYKE